MFVYHRVRWRSLCCADRSPTYRPLRPPPHRCLIVYPWTQRYFGAFGNLYNADAIKSNQKIAAHGTKVLHGLDRALKNMDNIKATYAELSILHSETLHVDPDNFRVKIQPLSLRSPHTICRTFGIK